MLFKVLTIVLAGLLFGRVFFRSRTKALGQRFMRAVDITFVVMVIVYGVQLVAITMR